MLEVFWESLPLMTVMNRHMMLEMFLHFGQSGSIIITASQKVVVGSQKLWDRAQRKYFSKQ